MQALVEAGSLEGERGAYRLVRPVEEAAVPASVQAVLAARIDRLGAAREGRAAGGGGDRQGVPRAGAGAGRRAGAGGARGRASRPRRGRVRLRAGALSRGALRLQAPADPGGRLRLAARRAPRRGPRRGRAGASPSSTPSGSTSARRSWRSTGRPPARRSRRRAGTRAPRPGRGRSDPTQALRHWRKVRELADTLPESAETAALGLDGEDLAAELRLAPRDLARGGGGRVQRGGADGLEGGGHPLAGDPALELRGASGG